jgi:hypothetical protein
VAAGFIAVSVVAFIVLGSELEGIPAIVLFGSVLGCARQLPGAPGRKTLKRIVEQLARRRGIGLNPASTEGVHPERLRKLAREGGRFTAQHLRALSPLRRQATLIARVFRSRIAREGSTPPSVGDCRDERRVHPDRRQRLAHRDLVAARGARTRLTISLEIVEIADDGTTIMWRSVMPKAKLSGGAEMANTSNVLGSG